MSLTIDEQWERHDARVTCYESVSFEDHMRRTETVHEQRRDGSCQCGRYRAHPFRAPKVPTRHI